MYFLKPSFEKRQEKKYSQNWGKEQVEYHAWKRIYFSAIFANQILQESVDNYNCYKYTTNNCESNLVLLPQAITGKTYIKTWVSLPLQSSKMNPLQIFKCLSYISHLY